MNYQKRNYENNPFTGASKRIKYLGTNLTNEVKDWYTENNDERNTDQRYLCRWTGRILLERQFYSAIYGSDAIPIKIPMPFFTETEQTS